MMRGASGAVVVGHHALPLLRMLRRQATQKANMMRGASGAVVVGHHALPLLRMRRIT
jgi:hypothetical protein